MPHPDHSRRRLSAFTLIELLTVIAIIGILAAIIIPTVSKVRQTARNAQCVSQLREWGRVIILYANDNKGNYYTKSWSSIADSDAPGGISYKSYFSKANMEGYRMRLCPAAPETVDLLASNNPNQEPRYGIIRGWIGPNNTQLAPESAVPLGKASSPSQYLLMMDSALNSAAKGPTLGITGSPADLTAYIEPLSTPAHVDRHNNRFNAVFGDGSVKRVKWSLGASGADPTSVWSMRGTWFQLK